MKESWSKGKKYWIFISFVVLVIIILDIFLFNYKQNILNEKQFTKNNIIDNSKENLDKYYNAKIATCPSYTLKQSLDELNRYDNISATIKQTKKDEINVVYINIISSNENISGTLKLDNGEIVITEATASSLEDTKYKNEINIYAIYAIYGLLCDT